MKPIVSLKIQVFQNSGFPFYHYFWRTGFRPGFSLFIFFEVSGSDSSFLSDSTLVLNWSFLWRFEFFKTRVFHFIIIFEDPGSDSGFPFLFLFEVSGFDSSFLSDSTLVLKPIVSLKIRVFQNSGFPFYHYFWRSGFRLGFSLFIFVWSLGFRLVLPIGFNARVETDSFFEDSSFSKLGFSILWLFLKIRVSTRVFSFYFRLKSRVPTRASYRIQPSCWNRSFLWRFEFFKTQVFHFIIIFEDPGSDSGFPFLFSFEVSGSDSSFLSDSTLLLKPIVSLKIRVFQNSWFPFYHYFWRTGFRPGFSLFIFVWSLGFRLELPIGFNTCVELIVSLKIRVFQNSGFPFYHYYWRSEFRLGFSIFIFVWSLGFRVDLVFQNSGFPFYHYFSRSGFRLGFSLFIFVWSLGFRLELPIGFNALVETDVFLKIQVFQNSGFPFNHYFWRSGFRLGFSLFICVWSLGFRLELFIGFNARVEIDRFFEDSSFSKLGFSILSLFLKIRVSTRVFSFYFHLMSRVPTRASYRIQRSCWNRSFPWRFEFFKTRVFHFIIIFEDPGSDSGFPFLFFIEVSGSDSRFLSDSTLVLKLIVSLKIRVFQNWGFPFYHYFWRSGFRLGFSLFIFVWSLGFRLELPIGFNARVETDRFFEDSSFSKLGFSILSLFLKIRVPTRVFPFYFRLKSWVPTRASYRIQRSCWNRSFLWRFEFFKTRVFHFIIIFEDPGSDSGFPFLFSFEVSGSGSSLFFKTRVFHFIIIFEDPGSDSGFPFLFSFEVSGSDSSFLSDSTLVLKPIVSLKIRVFQYSGFPFYHYFWRSGFRLGFSLFIFVWSLGFWLELPIGFNARAENDRFFDNSSFSKLGFFILLLFFKIWVLTRVFPFYFRLKSRVPTRASYRIQPSCWNRSFLWRFECFKTQVFHFIIIFEDPGSDSGFPFLFSFEVSGSDSSFLSDSTLVLKPIVSLNIRVFQNSGFPFYHYFWRSGFRPGFSLFIFAWSLGFWLKLPIGFNTRVETDRFFEDSSFSKLGFSILSLVLKIRVPTRVFPFYFRLKSRVPSRYCFSKLGFSILSLFFKIRVPTRVFPFYFRLKSRVLTRASYRIQRSCWNRSFLWRFEFFKT